MRANFESFEMRFQMQGPVVKAERARPAPGLLPPGGSRHHEKDSLEEGLRWSSELYLPLSLLPKTPPLPACALSCSGGAKGQL